MNQRLRYLGGCAVVLGLYALATLPILKTFPPVWPDEVNLYLPAAALARGQGMGTSVLAGFLPGIDRYTYWQPPGYFFFLSLVLRFVAPAHHFVAMRLFSWFLGTVVLVLGASLLMRLAHNKIWAFLGLVVLGTQVSFMQAANVGRMEMLALACTMAALHQYLAFRANGRRRLLIVASLFAGLAMLCHPAGILAPFVMAVHEITFPRSEDSNAPMGSDQNSKRESRNSLGGLRVSHLQFPVSAFIKNAVISAGCMGAVFVPWFIYIAQAPKLFFAQMEAQSIRKSSYLGAFLTTYGYRHWLMSPCENAVRPLGYTMAGLWPFHVGTPALIPIVILGVGLLGLLVKSGGRVEASVLGSWALGGYGINLFMPEFWYTVHFIAPSCLLLGWVVAESAQRWLRAVALATLMAAAAWNYADAKLIGWDCQDGWMAYKSYCFTLTRIIPAHSTILLAAIPDPYFGLLGKNLSYGLYEFLPVGVPVDRAPAEQALAKVDYVVGSECCRPKYLVDYLTAHGRIEDNLGQRDFLSPPVVVWKLQARRSGPNPQSEMPGKGK